MGGSVARVVGHCMPLPPQAADRGRRLLAQLRAVFRQPAGNRRRHFGKGRGVGRIVARAISEARPPSDAVGTRLIALCGMNFFRPARTSPIRGCAAGSEGSTRRGGKSMNVRAAGWEWRWPRPQRAVAHAE